MFLYLVTSETLAPERGSIIEIGTEYIAGDAESAIVKTGTDFGYAVAGQIGNKIIDKLIPGPTPNVSKDIKGAVKATHEASLSLIKKITEQK